MCVICYKPRGKKINGGDLKDCALSNPDGFGYMFQNKGKVVISKGYFDVDVMLDDVRNRMDDTQDTAIIFHFRIATSGKVNAANCHPYAVTRSLLKMGKVDSVSNYGFAHNGTLITSIWKRSDLKKHSDSMLFVSDILSDLIRGGVKGNKGLRSSVHNTIEMVARSNRSRFILMSGDDITLYGNGWVNIRGCFYSNDHWDVSHWYDAYFSYDNCSMCKVKLTEQYEMYYGVCGKCADTLEVESDLGDDTDKEIIIDIEWCDLCGDSTTDPVFCDGFVLCKNCEEYENAATARFEKNGYKNVDQKI